MLIAVRKGYRYARNQVSSVAPIRLAPYGHGNLLFVIDNERDIWLDVEIRVRVNNSFETSFYYAFFDSRIDTRT
jgi:hypothetical protein